jgi:hypothetical protein
VILLILTRHNDNRYKCLLGVRLQAVIMQGITEWLVIILAMFTGYRMMREAILDLDYPADSTADSARRAKLYVRVVKQGLAEISDLQHAALNA